ncbi:hypothetical protein [Romboutsia sp.]|uniref:hypothetical protein n=1 Tax=Romboutsia sp. TaxID=1965302 RepID=UPI002C3ACDD0|nr:hypothetical protein [Romboutsia sp.]HSQ87232.1 hypothetical protein [Romboutsia sp.]
MKYEIAKRYLVVMAIIFIIGLILTLSSVSIGRSIALDILIENGGMDTAEYQLIIKSYIESLRACGVVTSLLGGLGTLLSGYTLYNNTNEQS